MTSGGRAAPDRPDDPAGSVDPDDADGPVDRADPAGAVNPDDPAGAGSGVDREPDYRFTLANERTYLAWIRTALALLAAAVALHSFVPPDWVPGGTVWPALLCVLLSMATALGAVQRWSAVQRAMRQNRPLPPGRLIGVLTVGIVALCLVVLLGVSRR